MGKPFSPPPPSAFIREGRRKTSNSTTRIFAGLPEVLVMCGAVVDSGVVDHTKKEGFFLFLLIWDISRFHQSLSTWKEKGEQQYVANQKKEKQEAKLF